MKKYIVVKCNLNFDIDGNTYFLKIGDIVSLPESNNYIQSLEVRGYISTENITNPEIG